MSYFYRAAYSKEAERIFNDRELAREAAAKVMAAQAGGPLRFEVGGVAFVMVSQPPRSRWKK